MGPIEDLKLCSCCKKEKSLDDYRKNRHREDGLDVRCRDCAKASDKKSREKNRHRRNSHKREHYRQNSSRWRKNKIRSYGISVEDYNRMLHEQSGCCAACGNPETRVRSGQLIALAIDHCHESGRVRGLLCGACNTSLGLLRDDPERIRRLADYIESSDVLPYDR